MTTVKSMHDVTNVEFSTDAATAAVHRARALRSAYLGELVRESVKSVKNEFTVLFARVRQVLVQAFGRHVVGHVLDDLAVRAPHAGHRS
jgi:hypothetical protein